MSGLYLAPTYDHAASLGQNESDAKRKELLTTRDRGRHIAHYIEKARSTIYLNQFETKPLLTLDAFLQLAAKRPDAAKIWRQQLGDISFKQVQDIFNRIPSAEISETAIEFAIKLLELNKKRLLEVKL